MKTLIVSAVFLPEPVVSAKLSCDLASALSESKEVVVLSPEPTRPFGFKFEEIPFFEKFKHVVLKTYTCPESNLFGRLRETYSFGKETYKYICKNHKSISQIYSNTWPLLAQYYTVKAAKKYNIPIVIHVQDIYPESLTNKIPYIGFILRFLLFPIDRFVFKNTNHIIAISNKMKHYLARTRNVKLDKISVVANWQDENDFILFNENKELKKTKNFTFMYLGNIGPIAGVDLLIEAFVKSKLRECKLIIAGSGSMKQTLQDKVSFSHFENIKFLSVPNGKVQETQSIADVMLLPMKKGAAASSIPSKLPAYMFSKKPVIGCVDEGSDTALAIKESKCGWVLQPESIEQLTKCMIAVSKKSSLDLQEKGYLGYKYAIQNFSKKNNLQRLKKIIESI